MSGETDGPTQGGGEATGDDAAWGDLSLEEIMARIGAPADSAAGEPMPPAPLTAHKFAVRSFIDRVPAVSTSGRLSLHVNDPPAQVIAWARDMAGCEIGPQATWARFERHDLKRGALFIVHGPRLYADADLTVIAERGVLTRGLLVDVSKWLFLALGLWRVTVHLPVGRPDLGDLARRAGLAFEGVTRGHYRDGSDASRWGLLGRDCRWLAPRDRPRPPIPTADACPPASLKVH